MSKSSIPQNQMTLFDWIGNQDAPKDSRPLPLIVADTYKFSLRWVQDNVGDYWYSITDWIAGITGEANHQQSRNQWKALKHDSPQLVSQTNQFKLKAADGKIRPIDCLQDEGLYLVAQVIRATKERPQLRKVREYLAKAGVLVDTMRLNPETAVNFGISAYAANKKAPVWVESRVMGTVNRRFFTEVFLGILKENADFAHATDNIYRGTLGYSTEALRKRLGITNPKRQEIRDKLSIPALNALSTAEYLCALKLSQYADDETLPDKVVYATILEIAQAVGLENREIERIMNGMGLDYITGLPLLKKGHWEYE